MPWEQDVGAGGGQSWGCGFLPTLNSALGMGTAQGGGRLGQSGFPSGTEAARRSGNNTANNISLPPAPGVGAGADKRLPTSWEAQEIWPGPQRLGLET